MVRPRKRVCALFVCALLEEAHLERQQELAQGVQGGKEHLLRRSAEGDPVVVAELVYGAEIQEHRGWEIGDVLLRGRVVGLSQVVEG